MAPGRKYAVLIALTLAGTAPIRAFQARFVTSIEGQASAGSEVCFWPAESSDPISVHFLSNSWHCLSADDPIEIPAGEWNFMARNERGYVTAWPHRVVVSRDLPGIKRVALEMVPSGWLDTTLVRDRDHVVLYFPSAGSEPPFSIPVPHGAAGLPIPAGREFVPVDVREGLPSRIGEPLEIAPGDSALLRRFEPSSRSFDLVTWIRTNVPNADLARRGLENPEVSLRSSTARLSSARPAIATVPELVIFRRLSRDEPYLLSVEGPGWQKVIRSVPPPPAESSVALFAGIDVSRNPDLRVHWDADPDVVTTGPCAPPAGKAQLLKCSSAPSDGDDDTSSSCIAVREAAWPSPEGRFLVEFENIESGPYVFAAEAAGFPSFFERLRVDDDADIALERDFVTVSGRITVEGVPTDATIQFFEEPIAFASVGGYRALLAHEPGYSPIRVELCGDRKPYTVIPHHAVENGAILDIDLTTRTTDIRVETTTGEPIARSKVAIELLSDPYHTIFSGETGENGYVSIENFVVSGPVRACAKKPPFRRACSSPFRFGERATIVLENPSAFRGRLLLDRPIRGGRLMRMTANHEVIEQVELTPDGTFTMEKAPTGAEEAIIVSSPDLPLYAFFRRIESAGSEALIPLPSCPIVSFSVAGPPDATFPFTLRVGDVIVPGTIFAYHQGFHRSIPFAMAGRPTLVDQIAATGPVSVIRGLDRDDPAAPASLDYFLLPQYRDSLPLRTLGRERIVSFP